MKVIPNLKQIGRLVAKPVLSIFRGLARGGSRYAARQTEVYLMRHTDRGYEYELRREAECC